MADYEAPLFPQYYLSREELLLLLNLLKAGYILGLEPDPLGEGTPEQQARTLLQAERALRARELARLDEAGHLIVQNALLAAVGTCAYPLKNLVAHHFPPESPVQRCFGHAREDSWVFRYEPERGMYLFALHFDRESWLNHVVNHAKCGQLLGAGTAPLTLKGRTLSKARGLVGSSPTAARQALVEDGVPESEAEWLVAMLGAPHNITVFHTLSLQADNSLSKQELTVVDAKDNSWILAEPAATAGTDTYVLTPATTQQLLDTLAALL